MQKLYLDNRSLSGTIPSELGSLSNLQDLYLYNNFLRGTIPDSMSADKQLENPPYVETLIPDINATSNENFNLNVSGNFGDINDNITLLGANGLPLGLTIDSTSGAIFGTPTNSGSFAVTVGCIPVLQSVKILRIQAVTFGGSMISRHQVMSCLTHLENTPLR
ncbi:MAG: putative Ig domain-containing protein [Hormoscilla sp. GM7CHS1pb]|nr:putative Ig domain-containing protein [Hormoscilla sp. GM7CHS1pb]